MKRLLATVAVVATALLLLLLVWYGVSVFLLIFASVLLAIFFYNVSHFVSRHTALAYGWSLALVTLGLLALVGGGLWFTGAAMNQRREHRVRSGRFRSLTGPGGQGRKCRHVGRSAHRRWREFTSRG